MQEFFLTYLFFLFSNSAEMSNFAKYGPSRIHTLGVPYDYKSLMHFEESAFSKNGQPTITAKQGGVSTYTVNQKDLF